MKKIINIKLYNNDQIVKEYNNVNSIHKDETYTMILDDVKTIINKDYLKRETNEYEFVLDINKKNAIYTLKMNNTSFDIDVEKVMYKCIENNIILDYEISSEEGHLKIIIETGVNNE